MKVAIAAAYALMCLIWGTTWLAVKVNLQYMPPATGSGLRFILAGLFMYAVAAALGRTCDPRKLPWRLVLVLAVFLFGLNCYLTYIAETHISSGLAAVLFGVLPFFTFGFGHYLAGEKTGLTTWAAAALALAGVAVISFDSQTRGSAAYILAVVGAALCAAFANVYAKRHSHEDPLVTLPPSLLLSGIAVIAAGLLNEPFDAARAVSVGSIGSLLYLACASSALAFFLNVWLLRHIPVWVLGLSALIIPVIAVIVGIVFAGEAFGQKELIGAGLVIAGVWIALRTAPAAGYGS